jgi:DNA-binding NarL/FixJ family response regulator
LIAEHDPVSFGPACLLLALSATEDLGFAEGAARAALEANQRRGATGGVAMCSAMLALIVYRKGSVLEAEAYARAAVELTPPMLVVSSLGNHAALLDALVERGHLEEATAALETAGLMGELPQIGIAALLLDRRAQLFLARGDLEAARADLLEAEKLATGWGLLNPAFCSWRARSAALHARLGETDRARSLAAEDLERAEAYGASRAQGIARMTMGLAADDDHERIHWLSRAVGALEHSPASLEHARALAELGAALRRSNRRSDSRAPLQHAIDLARRCGAAPLAERAHDELRATSARPRRLVFTGVDSLTASELRIAKLAAGGRANPEIAQELYVTRKTVETHLTSVYRKLSITSRRELADALAR